MEDKRKQYCRGRTCFLTRKDLKTFTLLLRERFPDLFIFRTNHRTKKIRPCASLAYVNSQIIFSPNPPPPEAGISLEKDIGRWVPDRGPYAAPRMYLDTNYIQTLDLNDIEPGYVRPVDAVIRRLDSIGQVMGSYFEDDPETKRFVHAVLRLIPKFTTNDFATYDLETGRFHELARGGNLWAGFDAVRMGETDPDFYCFIHFDHDLNTWLGYKAVPREGKK